MVQVTALFERVCELDIEGIVAKRKKAVCRGAEKPLTLLDQNQESTLLAS